MSVHATLKAARDLLRTGWAEPFSLDERGAAGASRYTAEQTSVADALAWVTAKEEKFVGAWAALERVACPHRTALDTCLTAPLTAAKLDAARYFAKRYDGDLQQWLELPGRTLGEVLKLFDSALVRTLREA